MSIWTNPFLYYTRPCFINKLQKFPCKMFLMHLCWKRQIAANSVGTGWNLNYKCLIVCSLFFQKKTFPSVQVLISSEIYKEFCKIPHLAITGHAPLPPNLCPSNHTNQQTWNKANLLKKSSQNGLSSMKVHGFQAKWPKL